MNTNLRLLKYLLLCNVIVHCNLCFAYDKEETLCINDFTHGSLLKYNKIDKNGIIYRLDDNNNKVYPVYDSYRCYDLKIKIEQITSYKQSLNFINNGANLVVKTFNNDNNTYILDDINNASGSEQCIFPSVQSNTNLIIPENTTLDCKNVYLNFNGTNYKLLLLGTLTNKSKEFYYSYLRFYNDDDLNKNMIIMGPKSKYIYSSKNAWNSIYMYHNNKMILYPGCQIEYYNPNETNSIWHTIIFNTNLYLNRYTVPDDLVSPKLHGTVCDQVNIKYNTNCAMESSNNEYKTWKTDYELKQYKDNSEYVKTNYFPGLRWDGVKSHTFGIDGDSKYSFENPTLPLRFDLNTSKDKVLLCVNSNNDLAEYDIAFWNECSLNGSYGFENYNKEFYKHNYVDVDEIYKLFYGINKSNTPLTINTDTIYLGLIGNRNIELQSNNNKIYFYGDNSEYNGNITLYANENNNITDIYLGHNSFVNIILKSNLSNVTYHLLENNTIDLKKTNSNEINMIFDNTTNNDSSGKLNIIDTNTINEQFTQLFFNSDYSKYNGIITIPENITDVYVISGDLFYKIKHNLSNLTYHLLNNITIDLNKINGVFDMNLSNYDEKNKKYYTVNLIDSSDTPITTLVFNGNNTEYKSNDDIQNSGTIALPPHINKVIFKDCNSLVQLVSNKEIEIEYRDENKYAETDYTIKETDITTKEIDLEQKQFEAYNKPIKKSFCEYVRERCNIF